MSDVGDLPGLELLELLGFGSTGEVWRARERSTGALVAVKRLSVSADTGRLEGLRSVLAGLMTPHLVGLRAVVDTAAGAVLVLDLAAGGSVAGLLRRRGALHPGEVVTVVAPLAQALAEVHAAGLVHGSLTAAEVLLSAAGMPLLSDVGMAEALGRPVSRPADDVRALAALCRELLVGGAEARGPLSDAARPLLAVVDAVLAGDVEPDAATLGLALRRAAPARPVRLVPDRDGAPVGGRPAFRGHGGPGPAEAAPVAAGRGAAVDGKAGDGTAGDGTARDGTAGDGTAQDGAAAAGTERTPLPPPGRHRAPARARRGVTCPPLPSLRGRRPPRAVLVALSAVLILALAAGTGWTLGARGASAGARLPAAPLAAVPWSAVLDGLDRTREAAYRAGDPAALRGVYADGSPGLAADTALLAGLAAAGRSALGVRHDVREVRQLSFDGTTSRLRVRDVLRAHQVLGPEGTVVEQRAAGAERVATLVLGRTPDGWRLVEVRPA